MVGAPGAGKTCAQHMLLNEDRPKNVSTPIACPTTRAIKVAVDDKMKWKKVTRSNLLEELVGDLLDSYAKAAAHAEAAVLAKAASQSEMVSQATATPQADTARKPDKPAASENFSKEDDCVPTVERPEMPHHSTPALEIETGKGEQTELYHTDEVIREILATLPNELRRSDHWLYVIDSGGQPAYQELLPLFTRAASLNIITLDLSNHFNEKFELMYRIDEQYFPTQSKSTQLAFVQSAVSTGASFEPLNIPCVTKEQKHSMHLVLGTHYDKVDDAHLKKYEESLQTAMSKLDSYLRHRLIRKSDKSVIFPVNTIAVSEERMKYCQDVCQAIWFHGADASLTIKIPIRWFAFELALPDKSIIPVKEALLIGERYGMNEEDTKQALQYFHEVSIMLYYPKVTDVVFIDSKPLLDILSHLLALTYVNDDNALKCILLKRLSQREISKLEDGFFNEEIFHHLNAERMVFSQPEFQLSNLITLLLHLNVITEVKDIEDCKYFIPYALSSYDDNSLNSIMKQISTKPLLVVWREQKDKRTKHTIPVPQGLFPLVIIHLLNGNDNTEIPPSTPKFGKQYFKFRDAMSLRITFKQKHTLHIINRYNHIEVYFPGPPEYCPQVRQLVMEAIDSSSNAMHMKLNHVNAFPCPQNEDCYCIFNKDNHEVNCTECSETPDIPNDYSWFADILGNSLYN